MERRRTDGDRLSVREDARAVEMSNPDGFANAARRDEHRERNLD